MIDDYIKRIRGLETDEPLLVCESDGFGLRAAVIEREGEEWVLSSTLSSGPMAPDDSVAEVKREFEREGKTLPEGAILILAGVVMEVLELPPSATARPAEEMNEMIRWELDSLMAEQSASWSLGKVLLGLGYLDRDQYASLIRMAGSSGADRCGEVAIGIGLVDQEQLDRALGYQRALQDVEEELDCAWLPLDENEERWLATGVGRELKSQWSQAFAASGIQLRTLYPAAGPSAMALGPDRVEEIVLELHPGVSVAQRRANRIPQRLARVYGSDGSELLEDCVQAVKAAAEGELLSVALTSQVPLEPDFLETLRDALGVPLAWIEDSTYSSDLAGLYGAGLHAVGAVEKSSFPTLSTLPPSVPLHQRPFFFEAIGAGVLLALMIGLEIFFAVASDQLTDSQDAAQEQLTNREVLKEAAEEEQLAIESGKSELAKLEDLVTADERRVALLGERVPERAALIEFLFTALSSSVSPGVVIEKVDETEEGHFYLEGWSFYEEGAQQFIREFAVAMAQKRLEIQEELVSVRTRTEEGFGYGFSFRLRPQAAKVEGRP
jgi:hypothetical protein